MRVEESGAEIGPPDEHKSAFRVVCYVKDDAGCDGNGGKTCCAASHELAYRRDVRMVLHSLGRCSQLVVAPDCGSGSRGFKPDQPPANNSYQEVDA